MMRHSLSLPDGTIGAPAITDSTRSNIVLVSVGLIVLVSLVCVLVHRFIMQKKSANAAESSMTRPVLAVLLVGTLLILAAASLTFDDTETRNLLVGGVVSLSSAAGLTISPPAVQQRLAAISSSLPLRRGRFLTLWARLLKRRRTS
jgi:hypothetical protein